MISSLVKNLFYSGYTCVTRKTLFSHQDTAFLASQDLSNQHAKNLFYFSKSESSFFFFMPVITSSEAICLLKATKITIVLNTDRSKTKETPLLVASKMGIVEMVQTILKKFPIAIQDTDSNDKNILLLAVEHRQTNVYNWLTGEKYPEYVFYHVDNHGNNAVHLAAMYQKLEVWRIPGSALQLQGERKWYKVRDF